jgi:hypothetical protein
LQRTHQIMQREAGRPKPADATSAGADGSGQLNGTSDAVLNDAEQEKRIATMTDTVSKTANR